MVYFSCCLKYNDYPVTRGQNDIRRGGVQVLLGELTWPAWGWHSGCWCLGLLGSTWLCRFLCCGPGGHGHTSLASYSRSMAERNETAVSVVLTQMKSTHWIRHLSDSDPYLCLSCHRYICMAWGLTFRVMSSEHEANKLPVGSHLMAFTSFFSMIQKEEKKHTTMIVNAP